MKAQRSVTEKREQPKPLLAQFEQRETSPPLPPVGVIDLAEDLPPITQSEMVAFATAFTAFRLARADFEAKRAALTLKLLQLSHCNQGSYFARLDGQGNLVIENRGSIAVDFGEPAVEIDVIPSSGQA